MAVTTVRPNVDISRVNAVTDPPGDQVAAMYPTLSDTDATDATGVWMFTNSTTNGFIVGLGTFTLAANSIIARMRIRVRWKGFGAGYSSFAYAFYGTYSGDNSVIRTTTPDVVSLKKTAVAIEEVGGWKTKAPLFSWDQGALDSAKVQVVWQPPEVVSVIPGEGSTPPKITAIFVDVETTFLPVATVVAPTGTVSDTMQPTVTANYTDADGDPMERYTVRVFSAAQYGISGFDPTYSPFTWETIAGATGSSISIPVGVPLANGAYRAYVKFGSSGVASGKYGAWAYSAFTQSVVPANAPSLVVLPAPTVARNKITVGDTGPAIVAAVRNFELQRSYDGGVTWEDVIRLHTDAASPVRQDLDTYTYATASLPAVSFLDHEVKRGVAVIYRARIRTAFTAGTVTVSAWTTAGAQTLTATKWWLKSLADVAYSQIINVHSDTVESTSIERGGVFHPLGRAKAVVLSDVVGGEVMGLELAFVTEPDYQLFEALRARQETLLLQSPYGHHLYCRLGGTRSAMFSTHPSGVAKRVVTVQFVEVDAP